MCIRCIAYNDNIFNQQTWENPEVLDEATGYKGDNDPIDVLEIGYRVRNNYSCVFHLNNIIHYIGY